MRQVSQDEKRTKYQLIICTHSAYVKNFTNDYDEWARVWDFHAAHLRFTQALPLFRHPSVFKKLLKKYLQNLHFRRNLCELFMNHLA